MCCGTDAVWLDPDPFSTPVGSGGQDDLWASNECSGASTKVTSLSYNWGSSNTAVATMGPGVGWINGVSAGTSNITTYVTRRADDGTGTAHCVNTNFFGGGSANIISVSITKRTSGTTSSDNAGASTYQSITGTSSLGVRTSSQTTFKACFGGIELVGSVAPSAVTSALQLRRTILSCATYVQGTVPISCSTGDDTSDPAIRDDDPQSGTSGGKIYDLDTPGVKNGNSFQSVYRYRVNFSEYATLPAGTVISTAPLNYYVRLSCRFDASGNASLDTSVAGDNQIGSGATSTTWNLQ